MDKKRHRFKWVFLILQAAVLALIVYLILPYVRVSPGELTAVHAREPALEGVKGCQACHGESRQAELAASCATCHGDIQSQLSKKSGFHGQLPEDQAGDCGRCHLEHRGRDFPAVNRQSFAFAGVSDFLLYGHEGLGFKLTGKHGALECSRCHLHAETGVLGKGQKRFLGLEQTCTRCHKDVHEGAFGSACQSCHGQEQRFDTVAAFQHTTAFPLIGGHGALACVKCHKPGTPDSVSVLVSLPNAAPVRGCMACHSSPHAEEFLAKAGQPGGLPAKESCIRCHSPEQKSFRGPFVTVTKQQHAGTGFPLTAPHHKLECKSCHADYGKAPLAADSVDAYHRRYPGRTPDDCRACHGDPHRGEFDVGVFKGESCTSCHARQGFTPSMFDPTKHDAVHRLEGRHRKLSCTECHAKPAAKGPPDFRGVATDCRSCHKDPHGGQFDKAVYSGNDCRSCHTQTSWKPPTFTLDMHQRTSFALTGAHLGLACSGCHKVPEGDRTRLAAKSAPRIFTGVASQCSSCHADVHGGKFDGPDAPAVVAGRRDCARCHGTDSFRTFPDKDFDHAAWTRFALNGAHAKIDCASCHGRSALPKPPGRTLGLAAGTRCQSCHSDPHVGQFGTTASVNCAKCHKEEGSFRNIVFDHQKDSRFLLDETHVKVSCVKCHKPMPAAVGTTAVRYKPLGLKCGDCHDPRGPR